MTRPCLLIMPARFLCSSLGSTFLFSIFIKENREIALGLGSDAKSCKKSKKIFWGLKRRELIKVKRLKDFYSKFKV